MGEIALQMRLGSCMRVILLFSVLLGCAIAGSVTVDVDWTPTLRQSTTAATIEVDVMPFLGRTDSGGPFNAYYQALAGLGSEYVRFAPWFPNPRAVVTELTPSDCTAAKPATNWNSTVFDGIMSDFMAAVCGPNAALGACKLSVIQQLSPFPAWMFTDGFDGELPVDPWNTTDPFDAYGKGSALKDQSCGQMARYMGRIVGWYTNGGFHDECGHWHASGLHYQWYGLSVLNEDEHHLAPDKGQAYTVCFDAIKVEIAKINPAIIAVGPELCWSCTPNPLPFMKYFLNASNHADGLAPALTSYHHGMNADGPTGNSFFTQWDDFMSSHVLLLEQWKRELASETKFILNEYIPFVNDWCDCTGVEHLCGGEAFPAKCPDWQAHATSGGDPNLQHAKGVAINKKTLGWNAAAACFAYGFGNLASLDYVAVGQDQLVGGTWPDNEPAVSCMDWQSGQPNAKYWVTQLLAQTVGTKESKAIVNVTVSDADSVYAMPFIKQGTDRGILLVNKEGAEVAITIKGIKAGLASCVDGTGDTETPAFAPPAVKHIGADGILNLGAFGVAVVTALKT